LFDAIYLIFTFATVSFYLHTSVLFTKCR